MACAEEDSLKAIAVVFLSLVLAACATPYGSNGITGGYAEQELEPGIWRITYGGNGFTSAETVQTYWLYRAAELTLERGFDGFRILSSIQLVAPAMPRESIQVAAGAIFIPIYTGNSHKPVLQADIRLVKRPFEPDPPKVFDAAELKSALASIVNGAKCDAGNICPHAHHYLFAKSDQNQNELPTAPTVQSAPNASDTQVGLIAATTSPPSGTSGAVAGQAPGAALQASDTQVGLIAATTSPPSGTPGAVAGQAPGAAPQAVTSPPSSTPGAVAGQAPGAAAQAVPPPVAAPAPVRNKTESRIAASIVRPAHEIGPVSFRCPEPGTTIRTSTRQYLKFAGGSDFRCDYTTETNDDRQRYAVFADGFGRLVRPELEGLWPLQVGKVIDFQIVESVFIQPTDRTAGRSYQETFVVLREETVSVGAGKFDTVMVEWREQGLVPSNKSDAVVDFWYAPEVGYIVKSAVKTLSTSQTDPWGNANYDGMTYEAVEIAAPRQEARPIPQEVAPETPEPAPSVTSAPVATVEPHADGESHSVADRLRVLQGLLNQKLITPKEYEVRRRKILDSI